MELLVVKDEASYPLPCWGRESHRPRDESYGEDSSWLFKWRTPTGRHDTGCNTPYVPPLWLHCRFQHSVFIANTFSSTPRSTIWRWRATENQVGTLPTYLGTLQSTRYLGT